MEVPDYWLCEPCQSNNGSTSQCIAKQDSGLQASKRQQSARTGPRGKVKYLQEDEVIKLSSCNVSIKPTPPSSSNLLMTRKANPGRPALSMTRRSRVASKSLFTKIPSLTPKPNSSISPMAHGMFPRNGGQKNPITNQHASSSLGEKQNNLRLCFAAIPIIFEVILCDTVKGLIMWNKYSEIVFYCNPYSFKQNIPIETNKFVKMCNC